MGNDLRHPHCCLIIDIFFLKHSNHLLVKYLRCLSQSLHSQIHFVDEAKFQVNKRMCLTTMFHKWFFTLGVCEKAIRNLRKIAITFKKCCSVLQNINKKSKSQKGTRLRGRFEKGGLLLPNVPGSPLCISQTTRSTLCSKAKKPKRSIYLALSSQTYLSGGVAVLHSELNLDIFSHDSCIKGIKVRVIFLISVKCFIPMKLAAPKVLEQEKSQLQFIL